MKKFNSPPPPRQIAEKYYLENTSYQTLIWIAALAFLFCTIFKNIVNLTVTYLLLPAETVTVTLDTYTEMDIRTDDQTVALLNSHGWNIDYKSAFLGTESDENSFSRNFRIIKSPTYYIYVALNNDISNIKCTLQNGKVTVTHEVTEEDRAAGYFKAFPFADSYLKLTLQFMLYGILFTVLFTIFYFIHLLLQRRSLFPSKYWEYECRHKKILFFSVWGILFLLSVFQYKNNIALPHYIPDNALGDQGGYWSVNLLNSYGILDFDKCKHIPTYYGIAGYLLPSYAKFLGMHLGIDAVIIYLLFPSFTFSWLTTNILPQLYTILTGKKAKLCQILTSLLLFSFFWEGYLTLVVGDFYCATLFFSSIVYFLKMLQEHKLKYGVFAGFLFAYTVNWRISYLYETVIAAAIFLLILAVRKIICRQKMFNNLKKKNKREILHEICIPLIVFVSCSIPQGLLNYSRGHIGLFPYDSPTAYAGYPLMWSWWNTFLARGGGMVLWPKFIGDDQTSTLAAQLYGDDIRQLLHPVQAIDVYANNPIETIITIIKKFFTGMDIKTNIQYPDNILWRNTTGIAFSILNYFVLAISIYTFLKWKNIHGKEKMLLWLILIGTIAPTAQAHAEWRWFLPAYVILYYIFSYHFTGEVIAEKGEYQSFCQENFFRFLVAAELFSFLLSYTLWA